MNDIVVGLGGFVIGAVVKAVLSEQPVWFQLVVAVSALLCWLFIVPVLMLLVK